MLFRSLACERTAASQRHYAHRPRRRQISDCFDVPLGGRTGSPATTHGMIEGTHSRNQGEKSLACSLRPSSMNQDGWCGYRRIAAILSRKGHGPLPRARPGRSCATWASLPPGRTEKSAPLCPPATSAPDRTWWGATSAPAVPGVKWVGDIAYIRTWAGVRLPGNRPGLLHEEGGGLLYCQPYAHQPGVRRDRHGRAQLPPHSGRDNLSLRPRTAIHVGPVLHVFAKLKFVDRKSVV